MASADLGIFTTDASLVVTAWDDWLAAATGIPREAAVGRALPTLVPDLERRGLLRRFRDALESGTVEVLAPALHHYLIACPPRVASDRFDRMQQRVTIGPLIDQDVILGVIVTIEDVTSRLDAERDLAEGSAHADLGSDDWRVRQAAVEQLSTNADAEFMQGLVASLRQGHRDFNLLSSALKLLGTTQVAVTGALVELLHDPDPDLRIQAALALGAQHDPEAVPPLRAALADADANVRFQAMESLGRLRADAAIDDLMAIVESRDVFLAFAALEAIAAINNPRVAPRLVPLLESDALRVPVAEALAYIGDEHAVPALVGALNQSSRGVRSIATALATIQARFERDYHDGARIAEAVRANVKRSAHEALIEAIATSSRDELPALVRVLGWLDGDDVQSALTRLLADSLVRAEVVEALVRYGDRVVEGLIQQLAADDPDVRHAAVVALGRVGSPRATGALVSMLEDSGDLLVAVTGALARIGDKAAFEPLLGLLGHPDASVRQSAIGALNSMGHPQLPSRVAALLCDSDPRMRESAVRIAGYFGYPETVDALFQCAADDDEIVRRAALEHLPFLEDARVLPALVSALERDAPRARASAARALGRVDAPDATAALTAALTDGDSWVRYFAVRSLGEQHASGAIASLVDLAERDPAAHVRIAALDILGALGATEATLVLKALADDGDPQVAAAALGALGAIAHGDGLQPLLDALRAESPARRQAAIAALALHGSQDAVASLEWAAAADADATVVRDSIEALGRVAAGSAAGAGRAADALITLLSDRETRDLARQTIAGLPASTIGALSRGLQHPQPDVRSATVDVLGSFQCEEATRVVAAALDDSTAAVREAAVMTLARLGARGLEPRLAALSAHDPSKAVRRAAAAALSELRS
jgi:HEAT repeat protein